MYQRKMEDRLNTDSAPIHDMSGNALGNGRFSNRAARFYWADEEPSPQRAYSIQQVSKISSDSHFEDSPLVIASISAGVIGVAIIIVILIGIWIRSRLFSEAESRSNGENPNNISVRSSMSTLDEDAYVVCMEMDGTVVRSMNNAVEEEENNYCGEAVMEIEEQNDKCSKPIKSIAVPEEIVNVPLPLEDSAISSPSPSTLEDEKEVDDNTNIEKTKPEVD